MEHRRSQIDSCVGCYRTGFHLPKVPTAIVLPSTKSAVALGNGEVAFFVQCFSESGIFRRWKGEATNLFDVSQFDSDDYDGSEYDIVSGVWRIRQLIAEERDRDPPSY